ncbi:ninja-family protein AFP3-like isoform X2 [Impatiens glandulifera]|uniref:ninja-family protein AFP3-like isoform X2 n=1 Tax=Impatiens glandulifera TaxID=253017 RepID=UPI001FB108B5|nr:ninja-family protein AFP3-like isoform X2 [Impatiens glandulifera]
MDETGRGKRSIHKMEKLTLETKIFPRDFLQGFLIPNPTQLSKPSPSNEEDDTELNLGLSLGGRFGVDNNSNNKLLVRSTSIAGTFPVVREDDVLTPPPVSYHSLMRTSSLPVETEEEWRKRKELQTLRRMEAKRRRSEKQKNLKNDSGVELSAAQGIRLRSLVGQPPLRVPPVVPMDQSQCGSSSGMSESENRAVQGSSGEASPAGSIQASLQEQGSVGGGGCSRSQAAASKGKRKGKGGNDEENLEEMPCVFTEGDGPNGRRVEGILYKYGRGEEVRIMCVCHGHFLSPSEFVKHAGGSDVAHPLKHIVVTTTSSQS